MPGNAKVAREDSTEKAMTIATSRTLVVLGSDSDRIAKELTDYEAEFLVNKHWEAGMGSSISEGVKYVQMNWPTVSGVLIMLSDQPLIDLGHLNELVSIFNRSNCEIAATSYGPGRNGVPAVFSSIYFDRLIELSSDYGARQLIKENFSPSCVVDGEGKVVDIDTRSDYEAFISSNPRS